MDNQIQTLSTTVSLSRLGRAAFLTLFGFACVLFFCAAGREDLNPIQRENQYLGTTFWQLTTPADNRQIEGYASLTSVPVGGKINLFVNTQDKKYTLTVYRMGWYGGTGGRQVFGPKLLNGVQQITPTANATGVIECDWVSPYTLRVPASWVSGIYLVKLEGRASGKQSYITFTVRDSRRADLVFQQSVTTYQAYNPWPGYDPVSGYVGQSLYAGDQYTGYVSFNRPYGRGFQNNSLYGVGAGDFLTHDFDPSGLAAEAAGGPTAWEFGMIRWLEHQGYDLTYITDVDTHEDVDRLLRGKAFLSVGHDEYWSEQMRSNVLEARDLGIHLAFFSGNYAYWPTVFLPDSTGAPNRTLFVDKTQGEGGTFSELKDANGMSETEQLVAGGMWNGPGHIGNGDIVVRDTALLNHWVFAHTRLQVGDVIPGLIGYEYDIVNDAYPAPPGLQILLQTQAPDFREALIADPNNPTGGISFLNNFDGRDFDGWYDAGGTLDFTCHKNPIPPLFIAPPDGLCSNPWPQTPGQKQDWAMTVYQAPSGAWVFNVGAVQWAWGLDDYFTGLHTPDRANNGPALRTQCGYPFFHPGLVSCRNSAVEQITRNVLSKFIGLGVTPRR
jgi:hypothetical protein